jgi:ParB-like chromosome segregation protein Spo0J
MNISLKKAAAHPPANVYWLRLPPQAIWVLKQMRSKMSTDGLEDLAASIKESDQINPGIVVALEPKEAAKYLRLINQMWGTEYRLKNFAPVRFTELRKELYLFLVAGHRRLQAVIMADIPDFYCQVRLETTFSKALVLQFQENLHEAVPLDDEARFLTFLWQQEKAMKKTLSVSTFARKLGKKPEVVRRAIRFASWLPVRVQKLMMPSQEFKKGVAFGVLCELARLQEAYLAKEKPLSEIELVHLAYTLTVQQKSAKGAALWVSEQIKELNGQRSMFELQIQVVAEGARRSAASGVEKAVRDGADHLRRVARFHTEGGVAKVASGAAAMAVVNTIEVATSLAPKIVENLEGARHASEAKKALTRLAA